ncbi:MAG: lipopolysaccharide biosynthesis protein [Paludibacteraceae bacterium]|nr:lipopolysaccharide biosynthesis protein [Paludibacteraceae bacterium]
MAEASLKNKAVNGVGWSAADAILGQGVTFLVGIVLARLLSPTEYGLIGIISIFIVVLNGVVDSGFSNAIIRKQDTTNDDYNTMFFTNLGFSLLLYVGLYFSAPAIATFFGREELVALTRAMGTILIINALSITQVTILTKKVDFKTKTKASLTSAIISGFIGIILAYCGYGVWSLVAQQITKQVLYTLCLWVLNKWAPSLKFSSQSFKYMWGFGWKMMVSGLLNNIWNQLYQVVVGKFYSPATLGQYSRSKEYANILSANFTAIIQRVSYPILSELQGNPERMVNGYRKIIKLTMFVTAISMIFMGAVAEPLIYCLIGPQWEEAATYLPLICISMSLYPIHAINLNMLQVQGRSDIFLILEIIKKIIAIGPICLGIFVGIQWMLIGSIVTGIISFFLNSYYTGKKLHYTSWMQLRDIAPSYAIALVIALSVYFLKLLPLSYFVILPIQIVIGTCVGLLLCRICNLPEYIDLKRIIIEKVNGYKKHK